MATLQVQAWGIDGTAVVPVNADAAGDSGPNRAGLCLALENVHATLARTLIVEAHGRCNQGDFHDLLATQISVPPTPAGGQPLLIPLGWELDRFPRVVLVYTAGHAADLRVALVQLGAHRGVGEAIAAPPAIGATPGQITRVGQGPSDVLAFSPADADGMRAPNGDGLTGLVVRNGGGAAVDVHVHAKGRCSQGFLPHFVRSIPADDTVALPQFSTAIYGTTLDITYASPLGLEFAAVRISKEG